MEIGLSLTAVITELRSIKSPAETEMMRVTEIVEAMMMVLASEKWLFEVVMILDLTGAALAVATVQGWQCLSCCSSLLILMKAWTCS